jgi:hypothetical protein
VIARLLLIALALATLERAADACCLGCPCTKYQPRTETYRQPVYGYTHSVKGALPKWSVERVAAFLARGTWTPITTAPRGAAAKSPVKPNNDLDGARVTYEMIPALPLRFAPADQANKGRPKERLVLIRRIEKQPKAILVEVDSEVWKLAACPRKAGYVCLLPAPDMQLAPIPPPGDGSGNGFAKPPN